MSAHDFVSKRRPNSPAAVSPAIVPWRRRTVKKINSEQAARAQRIRQPSCQGHAARNLATCGRVVPLRPNLRRWWMPGCMPREREVRG